MFEIVFALLIAIGGVVVVADAWHCIVHMDRRTRETIRWSYWSLCVGAMVLMLSLLPALRYFQFGGAALVLVGVAGLVRFNKRRLFVKDEEDRTLVMDADDMTRVIRRVA